MVFVLNFSGAVEPIIEAVQSALPPQLASQLRATHVNLIFLEPPVEIFYESLLRHLVQLAEVGAAKVRL